MHSLRPDTKPTIIEKPLDSGKLAADMAQWFQHRKANQRPDATTPAAVVCG